MKSLHFSQQAVSIFEIRRLLAHALLVRAPVKAYPIEYFVRGWAYGLGKLLDTLKRQKVPVDASKVQINPSREIYRRRNAVPIKNESGALDLQWRGRMLAFLEMLSGETPYISLPLGETAHIRLDTSPMLFSSPVSTFLPDQLTDEQEEADDTTLGRT